MKKINDSLSVAPQIEAADVAAIAAAGFRSIVSNRPDSESPGQPEASEIEAAARAAGLAFACLPVIGSPDDDQGKAFGALMKELPGPVLAYCRSGTRSAALWSLAEAANGRDAGEIVSAAAAAGYDMRGLGPRLVRLAQGGD